MNWSSVLPFQNIDEPRGFTPKSRAVDQLFSYAVKGAG